jgi:hypothetical protein
MSLGEIVVNGDLMSGVEQFFRADRTDVARAAGDKNIHAMSMKTKRRRSKFKMKVRRAFENATTV